MRKVSFVFLLALLGVSPCFSQASSSATDSSKKCPVPQVTPTVSIDKIEAPAGTADLHSVIVSVQAALKCYQDNIGSGPDALPPLQKAEFDFKTTTGKIGGISVSFFVFQLKASKEKDTTNEITFSYGLKTQAGGGLALSRKVPPVPLADALVADLQAAAAAVKDAAKLGKLDFNQLKVTLQFGIQFDGTVGINVPIHLVTLGGSGEYKKNEVQSVTLTFAPPAPTTGKKQSATGQNTPKR
jgi:hypothetical protein